MSEGNNQQETENQRQYDRDGRDQQYGRDETGQQYEQGGYGRQPPAGEARMLPEPPMAKRRAIS